MTRVAVSKDVLQWAIERTQRPEEIEEKFPAFKEWVEGDLQPTLNQLSSFAKATRTPFGYFFLLEPPNVTLPIPYFRTIDNQVYTRLSADLIETVQTMQRRQAWLREYLIESGESPRPFVASVNLRTEIKDTADEIRSVLQIKGNWAKGHTTWTAALRELINRVDEAGILISISGIVGNNTRRKLSVEEFRGFVLVDEYAPLAFINGSDGKAAQMFTLAHELAHVWLGSSAAFDLRELRPADSDNELWANQVAAEFLVPENSLRQIWNTLRQKKDPFQAVARHFKVSEIVAARRALDLSYINRNQFLEFYRIYLSKQRSQGKKSKGGNFFASQNLRIGRRFGEAVVSAIHGGKLLYRDAYRLTGLHGKTFEKYSNILLGRE